MPQIDILLKGKADLSAFKNAEKSVEVLAEKLGHVGMEVGVGVLGARNAAKLLEEEVKHVIEKIDEIPGIPQETVDSVNRAKLAIGEARLQIDQWIAKGVTAFTQFGEGIGYFFGALIYGQEAASDAYGQTQKAADAAARAAEESKKKLKEEADEAKALAEAQKEAQKAAEERARAWNGMVKAMASEDQVGESLGQKIVRLRAEVASKEAEANSSTGTDNFKANEEAAKLRADLKKAEIEMADKVAELNDKQRDAEFQKLSTSDKLLHLNADLLASKKAYSALSVDDPRQLEQMVMLGAQQLEIEEQISELKKKSSSDEIEVLEKRQQRLQAERAIASQRGDQVEVNRLLEEERGTLGKIAGFYQRIADDAGSTDTEKEAARARIAVLQKSDAGNETSKIGSARGGYNDLSNPSKHFQGIGEGANGGILEYLAQVGTMADQIANGIKTTLGAAVSSITSGIMGWINGTMTWKQALASVAQTMLNTVLQTLIQIGVQQMLNTLLTKTGMVSIEAVGDGLRTARVAKENAAEAATLPAKTAGAAAAGISSFGVALIFGALAIALIIGALSGFASGGFTEKGGKNEVAGVVHKGEWVAPKWMTEDPEYSVTIAGLEAARTGKRGYSWGGFVGDMLKRGFVPKQLDWTKPKFLRNFEDNYNLGDGYKLYGKPDAGGEVVRPSSEQIAASIAARSGYDSSRDAYAATMGSSGDGSAASAAAAAGQSQVNVSVYSYVDWNELKRDYRRDPNSQKHIVQVVQSSRGMNG